MSLNFILASGNTHKAEELLKFFDQRLIQIAAAPDKLEVVEDGESFQENAFLKARAYYDRFKQATVADDSGLVVKALPGELGIYSARFGGPGLTDRQRTELLLEKMKGVPEQQREAYFVCVLCFYLSPQEVFLFEGRVEGAIGQALKGNQGFGYDPAFFPKGLNGLSLAEDTQWKAKNSHRAVACQMAQDFLKERVCQSK